MRGRVSYSSKKYSKTKNKYLKSCNPEQEFNLHTIHLDINSLYGYVMSKFLPTSGFIWIEVK